MAAWCHVLPGRDQAQQPEVFDTTLDEARRATWVSEPEGI